MTKENKKLANAAKLNKWSDKRTKLKGKYTNQSIIDEVTTFKMPKDELDKYIKEIPTRGVKHRK